MAGSLSTIFHCFLLLAFTLSIFSVDIEKESKEFIQLLIENCDSVAICSSRPVAAFSRVQTRLGNTPGAFLVADVLLWDPFSVFSDICLLCPSCSDQSVLEYVRPIRWKDGKNVHDQPRLLYGLRSDVVLVSRVYLCKNKHQTLAHDPGIISQIPRDFHPPFVLFHKSGVTRELFRYFISHIRAGMAIEDGQVLW